VTESTQGAFEERLDVQHAAAGDTTVIPTVIPTSGIGGPQDDGLTPQFEEPHLQRDD
jgi:hypothetical protein